MWATFSELKAVTSNMLGRLLEPPLEIIFEGGALYVSVYSSAFIFALVKQSTTGMSWEESELFRLKYTKFMDKLFIRIFCVVWLFAFARWFFQ